MRLRAALNRRAEVVEKLSASVVVFETLVALRLLPMESLSVWKSMSRAWVLAKTVLLRPA